MIGVAVSSRGSYFWWILRGSLTGVFETNTFIGDVTLQCNKKPVPR